MTSGISVLFVSIPMIFISETLVFSLSAIAIAYRFFPSLNSPLVPTISRLMMIVFLDSGTKKHSDIFAGIVPFTMEQMALALSTTASRRASGENSFARVNMHESVSPAMMTDPCSYFPVIRRVVSLAMCFVTTRPLSVVD